jgi:hypothetical protein
MRILAFSRFEILPSGQRSLFLTTLGNFYLEATRFWAFA